MTNDLRNEVANEARVDVRVLIADDEPAARRGVRQLLSAHPSFQVAGECRNGSEVLRSLDTLKPDVVFLDIQMPGLGGFDVIARRTPERMPLVVFLTAYDQYSLRAFDVEAFDYLVKPVSQARFDTTIKRLVRRLHEGRQPVATGDRADPRLVVTTAHGTEVVPVSEIDWIEASDNYVQVWTNGKPLLLRESLGAIERRISEHGFIRAHRRALVRVSGVRALTLSSDGVLIADLACGAKVPVSRRRRAAFTRALSE